MRSVARRLRVGIETLGVDPGCSGGVETYVRGLLSGMRELDGELDVVAFVRPSTGAAPWARSDNVSVVELDPGSSVLAGIQTRLVRAAWRAKIDILHHTGWYKALAWRGPSVVTVHDLIADEFYWRPELRERPLRTLARRGLFEASVRGASRVIVPTRAVKRQLRRRFGVSARRIAVTPEAPKPRVAVRDLLGFCRQRDLVPGNYLLTISRFIPHKNLERLVRAYLRANVERPLVIAGVPDLERLTGPVVERVRRAIAQHGRTRSVRFLGRLSEDDLAAAYSGARAFLFPSLAEGFGLPPLEAMQAGVPVAASDIPVHREVLADAAAYFPPCDVDAIARTLRAVSEDPAFRETLVRRGGAVAAGYDWETTARSTLAVYRSIGGKKCS